MYPVSDKFLESLRKSHTAIARCDLYSQDVLIASDIPVLGGEVTDDSQAIVRRRLSLGMPGSSEVLDYLPPTAPADRGLWPLGNELHMYVGIKFSDGTQELVPMGVFRISKPSMGSDPSNNTVSIEGYDRARTVSRARFTMPYVVVTGTNYATAIKTLIQSRLPWLGDDDFNFMTTNYVTPQLVFTPDDDPMEMAINMASSFGAEVLFDGIGHCVLRPEPDQLYTPSSFSYVEGQEAIITSISRDLDDEQAYNGVIVVGENSQIETPVRAEAWDTNPNSPTYYDPDYPSASVYGAVPYFITSQYITTTEQAQDAANANLSRVMGIIENINFEAINNPAHEAGDVITVGRARIGAEGTHILDSLTCQFGDSVSFSGTTRKRRVT